MSLSMNKPDAIPATPAEETAEVQAVEVEAPAEASASLIGSKSDKLELISVMGDPSRDDITPTVVNGETRVITTPTIVGYKFRALEEMDVPHCGLGDDARKKPMSVADPNGILHVKAGEEFLCTRFDTGALLSKPEFNARVTGGGKEFTVVYQKSQRTPKGADGSAAIAANADVLPTVSLRGTTISIKDMPFENVLDFTSEKSVSQSGKSRNIVTGRTPRPGYEYFEPLCRATAPANRGTGVAKAGATQAATYNKAAQAFAMMAKRMQRRG